MKINKMEVDKHSEWRGLENWINMIEDKDVVVELRMYMERNKERFMIIPGSIAHHHAYEGGLLRHTNEVIRIAYGITTTLFQEFNVISDYIDFRNKVITACVLHDVGKIQRYCRDLISKQWVYCINPVEHAQWAVDSWNRNQTSKLEPDVIEAILTHHGGWSKTGVEMKKLLSAVVHGADLISSRFEEL